MARTVTAKSTWSSTRRTRYTVCVRSLTTFHTLSLFLLSSAHSPELTPLDSLRTSLQYHQSSWHKLTLTLRKPSTSETALLIPEPSAWGLSAAWAMQVRGCQGLLTRCNGPYKLSMKDIYTHDGSSDELHLYCASNGHWYVGDTRDFVLSMFHASPAASREARRRSVAVGISLHGAIPRVGRGMLGSTSASKVSGCVAE